jgi:hypothetical protein
LAGCTPSSFSSENIFPPMHSAINALATKNALIATKSFAGLSFTKFWIMVMKIGDKKFEIKTK